jgi:poly-beta-hydroxyalkanoate depolymerase
MWHNRRVNPAAIRKTALFTVEGERDASAPSARPSRRSLQEFAPLPQRHHMQPGVGHYGVFSGRKWETRIHPLLRNVVLASEA